MAANEARVLIKVLAEIRDAQSKFQSLRKTVAELDDTIDKAAKNRIDVEVEQALQRLSQLQRQAESLQKATAGTRVLKFNADVSGALDEIRRLRSGAEDGIEKIRTAAKKNPFAGLSENAQKEAIALIREFKKVQTEAERSFAAISKASQRADFDPASKAALRLRDNVRIAAQAVVDFANKIPSHLRGAGSGFDAVDAAAKRAQVTLRAFPFAELKAGFGQVSASAQKAGAGIRTIPTVPTAVTESFASLATSVRAFLGSLVVRQVFEFGEAVAGAAIRMETLQLKFAALTGSTEKGQQALAGIREIADALGLNFEALATNFTTFKAAADSVGLTAEEVQDIFEGVAIASRGLGLSTEDTSGVLRAFTQILSKGKLQAEELAGQLGDRLPGAVGRLAEKLGMTQQDLLKLVESGEALGKRVVPALTAAFVEAFGPSAAGQAEGTAANMERLKNAILDAQVQIGNRMLPALNDLVERLQLVGKEGESAIDQIGDAMSKLIDKTGDLADVLRDLLGGNLKALAYDLSAVLLDTLGSNITAVMTLVKELVGLFSDDLANGLDKLVEKHKAMWDGLVQSQKDFADKARGTFRDNADEGKKSAEEIAKAHEDLARRLTEAAERAAADQAAAADKLSKEEAKIIEKREKTYEAFFRKLADLARKVPTPTAPTTPTGPSAVGPSASAGTDAATQQIARLREELRRLIELRDQLNAKPILSLEEAETAAGLNRQIATLGQTIATLDAQQPLKQVSTNLQGVREEADKAAAAAKQFGTDFLAALTELITGSEDFQNAFSTLSESGKGALTSLIQSMETLGKAGKLTQADLATFAQQFAGIMANGGAVSQQFAAQVAAAFGSAGSATSSLTGALVAMAAAQREARTESEQAALRLRDVAASSSGYSQALSPMVKQILDAKQGWIDAKTANDQFGVSLNDIKEKALSQGVVVREITDAHTGLTTALQLLGGQAAGVTTIFDSTGKAIAEVGTKAEETGGKIITASGKIIEIGKAKAPPDAAKSIEEIGTAGTEAGKGLDAAKTAADAAKTPLESVATAADQIAKATIPEAVPTGLREIGTAAAEAKTGLDPLAPVVDKTATAAGKLGTEVGAVKTGLEGITTAVGALEQALGQSQIPTLFGTLGEALTTNQAPAAAAGEAYKKLADAFLVIGENAGSVSTAIRDTGTSIQEQVDSGSLVTYAEGFDQLQRSTTGVATNLAAIAKALTDFAAQVQPTEDGAQRVQDAFDKLDLSTVKTDLGVVVDLVERMATGLGTSATNSDALNTALGKLVESIGTLGDKMKTFVDEAIPSMATALEQKLVPPIGKVDLAIKGIRDRFAEFVKLIVEKVPNDVFPIIDKLQAKFETMLDTLEKIEEQAKRNKDALANMDPGNI